MLNKKLLSAAGQRSTDANFKQTVLLLHGDGTNGAQNNTFVDGSSNNFTITRNGNTTQGTFTPFSQPAGYWSNYFAGGTAQNGLSTTGVSFGTGNFTVECWINPAASLSDGMIFDTGTNGFVLYQSGTQLGFLNRITVTDIIAPSSSTAISLNTWTHVAVVRTGTGSNQVTMYINGVSVATGTSSGNFTSTTAFIGQRFAISGSTWLSFNGYISNVRSATTAVYTSAFTPSTTPLTAITNTSLLTCQDNRFRDGSSNNFAITRNGDVRVTAFSPFAPSAAYSASVNGGSGYFDGTGDFLQVTSSNLQLGTSDFTLEFWWNTSSLGTADVDFLRHNQSTQAIGIGIYNFATDIRIVNFAGGGTLVNFGAKTQIPVNQWVHIAITRSGNNFRCFINGTISSSGVQTSTASLTNNTSNQFNILNGIPASYVSNYRLVKGTALYTSNFTPPTAPLTAVTNTQLLLNFTNAGIIDSTGKNVLETVGNAQIDTTVKKYGTGAMEFDGSGDYLLVPKFWNIAASEDFTIECWIYLTAAQANYRAIISDINSANLNSSKYIMISSTGLEIQTGTTAETISTITQSFSQNTWYHLAVVRSSGTISVYVDGVSKTVSQASQTGAFLDQGTSFYIGRWASTAYEFYGYIDDLRITKGIARYTANFTPPTAPFLDL